jgi:hypothetical protein
MSLLLPFSKATSHRVELRVSTHQSRQIVRMLGSFYAATAPHLVVEAFQSMGLIPEERDGEMYLRAEMQGHGEFGRNLSLVQHQLLNSHQMRANESGYQLARDSRTAPHVDVRFRMSSSSVGGLGNVST